MLSVVLYSSTNRGVEEDQVPVALGGGWGQVFLVWIISALIHDNFNILRCSLKYFCRYQLNASSSFYFSQLLQVKNTTSFKKSSLPLSTAFEKYWSKLTPQSFLPYFQLLDMWMLWCYVVCAYLLASCAVNCKITSWSIFNDRVEYAIMININIHWNMMKMNLVAKAVASLEDGVWCH